MDGKGNRRVQAERVESDIEQHIGQVEWAALTALLDSAIHVVGRFLPSSSATITLIHEASHFGVTGLVVALDS